MPFEKGHNLSRGKGRPKGSKNSLESIRRRVLYMLEHRLRDKNIETSIKTEDLLRFAQSLIPKDVSLKVIPNIEYHSNTPRPIDNQSKDNALGHNVVMIEHTLEDDDSVITNAFIEDDLSTKVSSNTALVTNGTIPNSQLPREGDAKS
jgi:hypothetical protein